MRTIAESTAGANLARHDSARRRYKVSAQLRLCEKYFGLRKALHSRAEERTLSDEQALAVLEALAVTKDTRSAFEMYAAQGSPPPLQDAWIERLPRAPWQDEALVLEQGRLLFVGSQDNLDLSAESRAGVSVLLGLLGRERRRALFVERSTEGFEAGLQVLVDVGVLAPATGCIKWGDLVRREPFCGRYGGSRGTVVDRYYLARFLDAVGHHVQGRTIEVGTTILTENHQLRHPFPAVTEYRTLDLLPGMGVDICGDLADHSLLERESLDTILCFNVLEHCSEPQLVVDNMQRWLAPGGRILCMVPSVQRVHEAPRDYSRILPSGMEYLFRKCRERKLYVYGNLQTTIAALSGLAIEDLTPGALDVMHPDYPVATCIVATK